MVALTTEWNLQFLSTDFWKHGQAGLIDICDEIYPTYWYGKQHPFEFEVTVVDNPSVHKIFTDLEIIANKAQPESFHFEIVGETYNFANDKKNMFWRQEARKALFQYNGADIEYDSNFLKIDPKQNRKSASLVSNYYERQDTANEIEDTYVSSTQDEYLDTYEYWTGATSKNKDYRHLSGAEIVYYPNRQEFRVWQHQPAINIDKLSSDLQTSYIKANCRYLEDRWKVRIKPILITYKNEYKLSDEDKKKGKRLFEAGTSTWADGASGEKLPRIDICNTSIPKALLLSDKNIAFPCKTTLKGKDNALYGLYKESSSGVSLSDVLDTSKWIDENIMLQTYGAGCNREEADVRDKFVKIRIRYSGEELAIIDWLNTVYQISYA